MCEHIQDCRSKAINIVYMYIAENNLEPAGHVHYFSMHMHGYLHNVVK